MTINVVPDNKKFKVLVNYIQQGISYSSRILAEHQADIIKKQYNVSEVFTNQTH